MSLRHAITRALFADLLPATKSGLPLDVVGVGLIAASIIFKLILYPEVDFLREAPVEIALWSASVLLALACAERLTRSAENTQISQIRLDASGTPKYQLRLPGHSQSISPALAGFIVSLVLWFGCIALSSQAIRASVPHHVWSDATLRWTAGGFAAALVATGMALNQLRENL